MLLSKPKGFTLIELIVGIAISTIIFGASLAAIASLEKCLLASDQYSQAESDEQRVMDYVARDLRGAYTVAVTSTSVTATVPDYYGGSYDSQGNPTGSPVAPTISSAVVNYGNPAQPLTILYYLTGSNLIRQQTVGATGAVSNRVISSDVEDLQITYTDLTSTVQYSVTFLPRYQWGVRSGSALAGSQTQMDAITGTTLTGIVSVRNTRK